MAGVNPNNEDEVIMSRAEFDEMYLDQIKLRCLENAGVDNWDGYSFAMELLAEYIEENCK